MNQNNQEVELGNMASHSQNNPDAPPATINADSVVLETNPDAPPPVLSPDAPPPKPALQRQTSVKFTNMQQMGSVRQIGQYRPELARPHNMTAEQAHAVEQRRQREAQQEGVHREAEPLG